MQENQDHFNVLRKIKSKPNSSQRELASELGFSLGKLNYCIKALKKKGLIKIRNFKKNDNKYNGIALKLLPNRSKMVHTSIQNPWKCSPWPSLGRVPNKCRKWCKKGSSGSIDLGSCFGPKCKKFRHCEIKNLRNSENNKLRN